MAVVSKSIIRAAVLTFIFASFCILGVFFRDTHIPLNRLLPFRPYNEDHVPEGTMKVVDAEETKYSLFMSDNQCRSTFPGLFQDIDDAVSKGRFDLEKEDAYYKGVVQGMIHNGNLYIHTTAHDTAEEVIQERNAILHALHRAITTSPSILPDTPFSLCLNDNPKNNSWVFARPNKHSLNINLWLMPHFSFWSWPLPFLGSLDEALKKIEKVEEGSAWDTKADKAVWRGTTWFNPVGNPGLRPNLLNKGKGKNWADIESLDWKGGGIGNASNAIPIEEFCRYKYIIYTEGVTYSGRLPYHQACASVLITPPLTYLQHTTYFIRPISSRTLLGRESPAFNGHPPSPLLQLVTDPSLANAIYVAPDWSDLEDTIMWLREHEDVARGIAERQKREVVGRGYLSRAAEVCYWRALIKGWAGAVEFEKEEWEGGVRWEEFVVRGMHT